MIDYPCRACHPPKRHPGCHGGCEAYLAIKRERDRCRELTQAGSKYMGDSKTHQDAIRRQHKRRKQKGGAI